VLLTDSKPETWNNLACGRHHSMPLIPIQDIDDSRLAPYRDLRGKQTAKQLGLFIAEGEWLVRRLLESKVQTHSVLVEEQHLTRFQEITTRDIDLFAVANGVLNEVVGFRFHRGIIACGYRPDPIPWEQAVPPTGMSRTVLCNQICDLENLGGVLRNAAAFGVDAVVVDSGCGDVFSRRVARVSMGTFLEIPIDVVDDLGPVIEKMRGEFEMIVYATVLDENAEALDNIPPNNRVALVFGNEGHGIRDEISKACTARVTLPMRGGTDSLNVATSVGVFLYHFCR
jgi:tRNA G18 (ribose-2'-O)-methylase SpoU